MNLLFLLHHVSFLLLSSHNNLLLKAIVLCSLTKLLYCVLLFFSWQPADHCVYMLKMQTFQRKIFLIYFLFVGVHVLSWLMKFKSLIQR